MRGMFSTVARIPYTGPGLCQLIPGGFCETIQMPLLGSTKGTNVVADESNEWNYDDNNTVDKKKRRNRKKQRVAATCRRKNDVAVSGCAIFLAACQKTRAVGVVAPLGRQGV